MRPRYPADIAFRRNSMRHLTSENARTHDTREYSAAENVYTPPLSPSSLSPIWKFTFRRANASAQIRFDLAEAGEMFELSFSFS